MLSFLAFIGLALVPGDQGTLQIIAQYLMLIGMLLVAVSRDRDEDEYTMALRLRAFSIAFVIGAGYTIVQPLVNYAIAEGIAPEKPVFAPLGSVEVIWYMLFIQIGFYYLFKFRR